MRAHTTAATAVLLLATLAACGGNDSSSTARPSTKPSTSVDRPKVDCSDQSLSQSEWMESCASEAGTGGDGTAEGKATGLQFGESYTWPDGLKVSVAEAKVFTDYDPELEESAEPGETDFRVKLKLQNTGTAAVKLDDLSTIIEGATNGGEAKFTTFENGSEPLEGRLAPGQTAEKTDDNVLETQYGRKIVVTVQRSSENLDLEFPEFNGTITG